MSIVETLVLTAATLGGGFFVGVVLGFALKKVIKLVAVIVGLFIAGLFIAGLFIAGLAYLQYHQIANINWNKLQTVSEGAITTLSNVLIQILDNSGDGHAAAATVSS